MTHDGITYGMTEILLISRFNGRSVRTTSHAISDPSGSAITTTPRAMDRLLRRGLTRRTCVRRLAAIRFQW